MKPQIDISGKIGPSSIPHEQTPIEWPMYSFDRPAYMLWGAIANGLKSRGWTEKQIKDWLQSKHPRWALDCELGEALEKAGAEFAKTCIKVKP